MSSTPSSTYLSSTSTPVTRGLHRHKRSGAISGDFDLAGLGLVSPNQTRYDVNHTTHKSSPVNLAFNENSHSSLHPNSLANNTEHDTPTRHFQFSNEEDFTNKPLIDGFHFPSLVKAPTGADSGRKGSGTKFHLLNSPIRLKPKGSFSSANGSSKLFLTEDTFIDDQNIPDALIDLDKVVSATSAKENPEFTQGDSSRDTDQVDFFDSNTFLPPIRLSNNPAVSCSSPYSSPAYTKHPIKEPANDAIEEEEDNEGITNESMKYSTDGSSHCEDAEFNFVPHSGANFYSASINSSVSSLPNSQKQVRREFSSNSIENISSNNSRNSPYTFFEVKGAQTPKRSGAKANRYQAFYEQSTKISSSLKISSSETIHLIAPFHSESLLLKERELRPLEHSLSLPSLRSGKMRVNSKQMHDNRSIRDASKLLKAFDTYNDVPEFDSSPHSQRNEHFSETLKEPSKDSHSEVSAFDMQSAEGDTLSVAHDGHVCAHSTDSKFQGICALRPVDSTSAHPRNHNKELTSRCETATPTIVVFSESDSIESASPDASTLTQSQASHAELDFTKNIELNNRLIDSSQALPRNISEPMAHTTSSPDRCVAEDGEFSLSSESKSSSSTRATKAHGESIRCEDPVTKPKRISRWLKRFR